MRFQYEYEISRLFERELTLYVRWIMRSAECRLRKIRKVENAECGKCEGNFNFPFQFSIPMRKKQCGRTTGMLTNLKKRRRSRVLIELNTYPLLDEG